MVTVKLEKDQKQTPKPKYDDFPTLLKYLMNSAPEFKLLKYGAPVIHTRPGTKPPGFRKAPSAEPAGRQRPYLGRYCWQHGWPAIPADKTSPTAKR